MKNLTISQMNAIQSWMENLINRPFRDAFREAFPTDPDCCENCAEGKACEKGEAISTTLNPNVDVELLKTFTSIKQVKEYLETLPPKLESPDKSEFDENIIP